jgi:hypothetical protein
MLLNAFLLIVGCMMDIFSATVVVVPLLLPIAASYGVDPIHLGIIFLANLEIGYSTPPVGINLFIASQRFGRPVLSLFRATIPFLALMLLWLIMITYVPYFTLWWQDLWAAVTVTGSALVRPGSGQWEGSRIGNFSGTSSLRHGFLECNAPLPVLFFHGTQMSNHVFQCFLF